MNARVIELTLINSDANLKIELPIAQLNILHYLCDESNPYETGGIIIGKYSDDGLTAHISEISNSPADSVKKKAFFKRGIKGLQKRLDTLWKDNYYYLGEWHYHPNSMPTPSSSDIKQMISLSQNKKLNCPEPILIIIGGNREHWLQTVIVVANETIIPFYEAI
ncbi:MAG: hypothetical protein E7503_05505 [Ruminococcus sp.]|nr:hypothetical protein [Ruminococcus sp.]